MVISQWAGGYGIIPSGLAIVVVKRLGETKGLMQDEIAWLGRYEQGVLF